MRLKKNIAKVMAAAMLLGMFGVAAPAVSAKAETVAYAAADAKIDYAEYKLTITPKSGDNYVFVEISKKGEDDFKATATYAYKVADLKNTDGKVVIDLSFLKPSKEQYIRVYGDVNTEYVEQALAAQPKKMKIKYTVGAADAASAFEVNGTKLTTTTAAAYQYKPLYASTWNTDLSKFGYKVAELAGTTILVRTAELDDSNNVISPYSTEVKVKIKAAAKAPKIKIDYLKGTIKFPKNVAVALASGAFGTTSNVDSSKAYTTSELATATSLSISGGTTIAVRTIADDKKAASNVAVLKVPGAYTATLESDTVTVKDTENEAVSGYTLTWEAEENGVTFTAKGGNFDYSTDGGKKWSTLKKSSSKTLKYSSDKVEIKVRVSGEKPTDDTEGRFPSSSVDVSVNKPDDGE